MTTTEDSVSFSPAVRRQQAGLCVVVGAAVTVGWVLYRHYWFFDVSQRVFRWQVLGRSMWVAQLIQALLLLVPYGVVLVLWGRDLRKSLAGAAVTVVTAVYVASLTYVFQRWVFGSDGTGFSASAFRTYDWLNLLVPAVLVPLAWGLARRQGRAWTLGLVIGPAVAAVLHEVQLHSPWWQQHVFFNSTGYHWELQAVVFVAPFVLAVLSCWALEVRAMRSSALSEDVQSRRSRD